MNESRDYALGYSGDEGRRLVEQAKVFEDLTEDVLRRAGLRSGMQVLDIGSGVGDVSLLAARMVGTTGRVLGVDRASSSVEMARRRVAALGIDNVRFERADLETLDIAPTFDAVIGRLVLQFLPDPSGVLRRLGRCVRPGGIIAFQEVDIMQLPQPPGSELFSQVRDWIIGGFTVGGVELNMGSKLLQTFLQASLPRPAMIAACRVESGPLSPAYGFFAQLLRTLLPLVVRGGIASESEIDIDTLSERLRQEAVTKELVIFFPRLVGAWTRLPLD